MLELSKMRGHTARSWAPLCLLLVCLHFPGIFSRSISAAEEKAPQDLGPNLPKLGQPSLTSLTNAGHPQPNPVSESDGLTLNRNISPSDGSHPAEYFEYQRGPQPEELPPMDSWSYEDPWWMMAAMDEDYAGAAMPEELSFLSGAEAHPPGGPVPAEASTNSLGNLPESPLVPEARQLPRPIVPGAPGRILGRRPLWSLINKIRHPLLSGRPWGTLNPSRPWGVGGLGTGWGTRPMPNLVGAGGIKNQYPIAGWGRINQFPGTSWGNINQFPGSIWEIISRLPGGIWGNINQLPGGIWGNINRYPGSIWGNINRYPGTSWGNNHLQLGANNKLPAGVVHPPSSS